MLKIRVNTLMLWIFVVFFFSYQFVLRLTPGVLIDEIMYKYNINASTFGLISAFYYVGYAGMQIPIGALLDKYGVRYVVATGAIICSLGNILMLVSDYWVIALVGRLLIGIGSAAGALGAIQAVRLNFSRKHMSKMIGFTVTISLLGAIYGKSINRFLYNYWGVEDSIIYLSIPGIIIALGILLFTRDSKYEKDLDSAKHSVWLSLKEVFSNKQILWIAAAGALMVGPLGAFADIFGEPYFVHVYGFTPQKAGYLSASAIYFGFCIGAPLLAAIAERFNNYYNINIVCGFVMTIAFHLVLEKLVVGYNLMFICMFIVGIMCAYQVIVISTAIDLVPVSLNGITIAVINMFNMTAGMLFNTGIGSLLDYYWTGDFVDGKMAYSDVAYTDALYILPVTCMFGAILFFVLKPSEEKD